jgi:hypothetical protein
MHALGTVVIYALVGLAVAITFCLREVERPLGSRLGIACGMIVFWPLLAPMMFTGRTEGGWKGHETKGFTTTGRVGAMEARLVESLRTLEGGAGEVVFAEVARVRGLLGALAAMEVRLGEMDALLGTSEFDDAAAERDLARLTKEAVSEGDPRIASAQARKRHALQLKTMRAKTAADFERALLRVDELASRLRLLRFAGRDDGDTLETIRDVAETIAGVTDGMLAAEG